MEGLAQGHDVCFRDDLSGLRIERSEQAFTLVGTDEVGETLETISVPFDKIADHVHEYVDVVRQMAKAAPTGSLARLEALDMAKKVCHDRAGRTIERACRKLGVDHPTGRRLFTLLVTLKVDTTRLVGVHGHRRIR